MWGTPWYPNLNHWGDSTDISSEDVSSLDHISAMVRKENNSGFFSFPPRPNMCF